MKPRRHVRLLFFLVGFVLPLLLCSCVSWDPGYAAFVAAERQTKQAVGTEYLDYVRNDPKLNKQQKGWREEHLARWETDLQAAESRVGGR